MEVAGELIKTITARELTYEEAKEALDAANQVLLNKLLSKTKMRRQNKEVGNSDRSFQNLLSTSIGIDSSELSKKAEKLRDVIRKQSEKLKG